MKNESVRRARPRVERLESRCVPSTFNLTPLVPVSGPSPFHGSPIEANDPPGTSNLEFEPHVAVDPTDTKHLVGAWIQDANRGIVAGVSFDGGNAWRSVVIPGLSLASGGIYPHSFDPWVSFAPNGDVYLSSLGVDASTNNPNAILVSKSADGGLTWGAPVTIAAGTNQFNDKPSITADPTNSQLVYAAWTRFRNYTGLPMFARSTDGGQTWEPALELFHPGGNNVAEWFQIEVLADGTLVNVFAEQNQKNAANGGSFHYDVKLSAMFSSDHGQTWQCADAPVPVADIIPLDDTLPRPGVPNPDGGLGVRAPAVGFDVATDPTNGNLYAVWPDARFGDLEYTSIAFSMSGDGGSTWSVPIRVNQTPATIPAGNRQAFLPSVAVNKDGVVAVTYYDFRNNTSAPGLPTDVWMVHAHPADGFTNPASWSNENRLTPASFNMAVPAPAPFGYFVGDYQSLVAMGKSFGAFWAMPPGAVPTLSDQGSIFFRDPLPVEGSPIANEVLRGGEVGAADPGGKPLGFVSGIAIGLDDSGAGVGWSVDRTPRSDSARPRDRSERQRADLLRVLTPGTDYLLGNDHQAHGVMAEGLTGDVRWPLEGTSLDACAPLAWRGRPPVGAPART